MSRSDEGLSDRQKIENPMRSSRALTPLYRSRPLAISGVSNQAHPVFVGSLSAPFDIERRKAGWPAQLSPFTFNDLTDLLGYHIGRGWFLTQAAKSALNRLQCGQAVFGTWNLPSTGVAMWPGSTTKTRMLNALTS
jgi:hypothetical protein